MILLYYYFKLQLKEPIETIDFQSIKEKIDFGRKISSICKKLHIDEEDLKLICSKHLTNTYNKSAFSNVLDRMVSTSNNFDAEYDELLEKHEQTLDEHFFMGEIQEYLEYHLSKMIEVFSTDNSIFKTKSSISNYDKIENLDKVLTDELKKNYSRYSFKTGANSYINKTIGIHQIFINVLQRYKSRKDSNKAGILFSLLQNYENDEIDKYHIINKIDASTNILFDEYLQNNISFPKDTENFSHNVHQLFALISLFPDIELKLAVIRGVLVALNEQRAEDLIYTIIELLLYVKTLDHLLKDIQSQDLDIVFDDFKISSQNDHYECFIINYFQESTKNKNNMDTSLSIKHRDYIKEQIDKLLKYNKSNYLNFMEFRTYKVPTVQIRKKNSHIKYETSNQPSPDTDFKGEQHSAAIKLKKISESQSKNSIVTKFIDIVFTYLYLMSEMDYDDDQDESELTLSNNVPIFDQDLSISIKGAILTVVNILLEHIMPISINKIKSDLIDEQLMQGNKIELIQAPITLPNKDELFEKYQNNQNIGIENTPTFTLFSEFAKNEIEDYLSNFTTKKFDYIISIITPK